MHAHAQYLNSFVDLLCVGALLAKWRRPRLGSWCNRDDLKEIASVAKVIFLERFCVV